MYYAPRRSPEKPGMPVLGYFVVVGTALLGLLFASDAYMAKPAKLTFASNFDGLPAEYKGEASLKAGTSLKLAASAPHIASVMPVAETTGAAPAAEPPAAATPQPVAEPAKAKPQRKVVHKRQRQEDDDWFGNNSRRDFASGSRDPFASSSRDREPSWRDSWASGSFDQPRERPSRRASRQNNDFWSFR